jgi:glycosyltransferase involved in cell wall biosynthesis
MNTKSLPTRISVALCTYNGERYLAEQLASIAAQSHPVDEIILCDDGSSDATLTIAQHFQAQGLPLQLYRNNENLGFVKNFAQAITHCTGDIIFLCDQDDCWYPQKVATMLKFFTESAEVLLIFSDGDLVDSEAKPLGCHLWQALPTQPMAHPTFHDLLNNDWITGAACAFRRELIPVALPFPSHDWVHDAWLGIIASIHGRVMALSTPLIAYRQHNHNQIGLKPPTFRLHLQKIHRLISTPHTETAEKYLPLLSHLSPTHPLYSFLSGKLRHLQHRQPVSGKTLSILKGIALEISNRGYWDYANGWQSIMRDVSLALYQTMCGTPPPSSPR